MVKDEKVRVEVDVVIVGESRSNSIPSGSRPEAQDASKGESR